MQKEKFNGNLITNYLTTHNLSVNKFCKQCKVTKKSLFKVLNNDFSVNIVVVFKIARFLNINTCEMFI